jgi:hypothetical protein
MYSITSSPSFEITKQTSAMKSATEYKIAASIITRNICIVGLLVIRAPATLRSIVQMRHASKPEQIRVSIGPHHHAYIAVCLPVPNKLVASVDAKYAVTHCEVAFAKMFVALVVACEAL